MASGTPSLLVGAHELCGLHTHWFVECCTGEEQCLGNAGDIGSGFLGVFCCAFLAWNDQHKQLVALKDSLKAPEMKGVIESAWWGQWGRQTSNARIATVVVVDFKVTHKRGVPSGAINWKMDLVFPKGTVHGDFPLLPVKDIVMSLRGRSETITLMLPQYLPTITEKAMAPGDTADGWFRAVFYDVAKERIGKESPEISISFEDAVTGTLHSFSEKLKRTQGITIPGDR
jgi:hypothetical protein